MPRKVGKSGQKATALARVPGVDLAVLQRAQEARAQFEDAGVAGSTERAFKADWGGFRGWMQEVHGLDLDATGLPPRDVAVGLLALYLSTLGVPDPTKGRDHPLKMSTIRRAYTGILFRFRQLDPQAWPPGDRPQEIRKHLRSMAKKLGLIETRKRPLTRDLVGRAVEHIPGEGSVGVRNLGMLLFGWATASRRKEIVDYDLGDVRWVGDRAEVTMRRSKTDQEGKGKIKVLEPAVRDPRCCPVAALRAWLDVRGDWAGPLFVPFDTSGRMWKRRMSARIVSRVVKDALEGAGLTEDEIEEYAGHSLRAGFATTANKAGKSLEAIARQTGHSSLDQLRKYIRILDPFEDNAAEGLL
jgi:integrase